MTDAGRAKMLLAAVKHGLDIRDVAPSVSLFKGVRVGDDGSLGFTGSAGPGGAVDLLIHLPVVIALVNTAHPLDPDPALTGLDVLAWRAGEQLTTPFNDEPEYLRALFNTESTWAAAQTRSRAQVPRVDWVMRCSWSVRVFVPAPKWWPTPCISTPH